MASDKVRNVNVPVQGAVLKAIEARAEERDLPLGRAAISLIEDAMSTAPTTTLVNLEVVPTDDIIDELVGRLQQVSELELTRGLVDAAIARAEAAEGQLAVIRGVLEQVRPQG